jgi:hypothetical protein
MKFTGEDVLDLPRFLMKILRVNKSFIHNQNFQIMNFDILISAAGFVPAYVRNLTLGAQKAIKMLVSVLLLSSCFSAFMLAQTVSVLINPGVPFFIIWAGFWSLIFVLERSILSSAFGQTLLIKIRFAMALVIAFITSLSVELSVFGPTAANHELAIKTDSIASLNESYQLKVKPFLDQRLKLQSEIKVNQDSIIAKRRVLDKEIYEGSEGRPKGDGIYAAIKRANYQADSANIEQKIAFITSQIYEINGLLYKDSATHSQRVLMLDHLSSTDPVRKIQSIHIQVFSAWSSIFLYIIVHLFFLFFELFVIIGKYSYKEGLDEYNEKQAQERTLNQKRKILNHQKVENETLQEYQKDQIDYQYNIASQKAQIKLDLAKEELEFLRDYNTIISEAETIIASYPEEDKADLKQHYHEETKKEILNGTQFFKIKL